MNLFNLFQKTPNSREQAVNLFFHKYEQWAIAEYKFLQVPTAFKVGATHSEAEINLLGEVEVLALEAHKCLVDLQNYTEKLQREHVQIMEVEWRAWRQTCLINPWFSATVASIAPASGLVTPLPTNLPFLKSNKEPVQIHIIETSEVAVAQ